MQKKKDSIILILHKIYKLAEKVLGSFRLPAKKIITKINLSNISLDKNFEYELEKKFFFFH